MRSKGKSSAFIRLTLTAILRRRFLWAACQSPMENRPGGDAADRARAGRSCVPQTARPARIPTALGPRCVSPCGRSRRVDEQVMIKTCQIFNDEGKVIQVGVFKTETQTTGSPAKAPRAVGSNPLTRGQ